MIGNFKLPQMEAINHCAQITGLAKYAVRQLVLQNKVKYIRCGKKYLVNLDSLIEYLNKGEQSDEIQVQDGNKIRKAGM